MTLQPGDVRYAAGVRAGRWIFATGHKATGQVVDPGAPRFGLPKHKKEAQQIFAHLDEVLARVDDERDRLETPVSPDVAQVHLTQLPLLHGLDEVVARELGCRLLEQAHQRMGFEDVSGHVPVLQQRHAGT